MPMLGRKLMRTFVHADLLLELTWCGKAQAGMIPIQMELGGKDACIVCHDADIELAAKNIVKVRVHAMLDEHAIAGFADDTQQNAFRMPAIQIQAVFASCREHML